MLFNSRHPHDPVVDNTAECNCVAMRYCCGKCKEASERSHPDAILEAAAAEIGGGVTYTLPYAEKANVLCELCGAACYKFPRCLCGTSVGTEGQHTRAAWY